jgi:ankyrin repeat protein
MGTNLIEAMTSQLTTQLKNVFIKPKIGVCVHGEAMLLLGQGADINVVVDAITEEGVLHKIICYNYSFLPALFDFLDKLSTFRKQCNRIVPAIWDINRPDIYGYTPLHRAILGKNTKIIELLLTYKSNIIAPLDINKGTKYLFTPLHLAVMNDDEDIVSLLLQRSDLTLDKQEAWGNTPLHYAVDNAQQTIVEDLIVAKARCDILNNEQKSAFDFISEIVVRDVERYNKFPAQYYMIFGLLLIKQLQSTAALLKPQAETSIEYHNNMLALEFLRQNLMDWGEFKSPLNEK